MGSGLLLQIVLILLNAFFAASEIAVISLNEGILRKQAEEGHQCFVVCPAVEGRQNAAHGQ